MTLEETAKVLSYMAIMYPDTEKNRSDAEFKMKVRGWQRLFDIEPMNLVTAALDAYMSTSVTAFAPSPGQLKEQIRKLSAGDEMMESDAWALVSKALRNSSYGFKEEYEKLPESVKRCVGYPEQLQEWARMDEETVASVVASNFQRNFRYRKQHDQEVAKLPESVRPMITGIADRMRLEA